MNKEDGGLGGRRTGKGKKNMERKGSKKKKI